MCMQYMTAFFYVLLFVFFVNTMLFIIRACSIVTRYRLDSQFHCSYLDSRGVPENREKKQTAGNYLPFISVSWLPVTSYPVMQLPVMQLPVTSYPVMQLYLILFFKSKFCCEIFQYGERNMRMKNSTFQYYVWLWNLWISKYLSCKLDEIISLSFPFHDFRWRHIRWCNFRWCNFRWRHIRWCNFRSRLRTRSLPAPPHSTPSYRVTIELLPHFPSWIMQSAVINWLSGMCMQYMTAFFYVLLFVENGVIVL
jgi:hypothetical protein